MATKQSVENIIPQGARLGDEARYVIGRVIAIGGMGVVYHARDLRLGDVCAVKAVCINSTNPGEIDAFSREARLLAAIRHPGVVAVRDNFEEMGYAFLVMDYVPGLNLYDLHKREPAPGDDPDDLPLQRLPEAQVVSYGRMLAETMLALHRHDPPIIYRDFKPHNIIRRDYDGRLVLLDFGIARFRRGSSQSAEDEPVGTPGYAAPEQYVLDSVTDERTDIYELGVVLLELATGYNPRDPQSPKYLPLPRDLRPEMSSGLARILQQCTETDRERRYPSAETLYADLVRWRPSASRESPNDLAAEEPNWTFDLGGPITAAAFATSTTVYYADNGGMVCALNPQTGEPFWLHRENAEATARAAIRITASITRTHRMLAHTYGFVGSSDSNSHSKLGVSVIEARSGKTIWATSEPLGRNVIPVFTDTGMLVCAVTDPNELVGISLFDPSLGWRRPLDSAPLCCVKAPAQDGRPEVVLVGDRSGMLRAYIGDDGRSLWATRVVHGPLVAPPLVARDRIYLGGVRGDTSFAGVDLLTGEILWKRALTCELVGTCALVFEADVLVVPTRNAGLVGLHPEDGDKLWQDVRFSRTLTGAVQMPGQPVVAVTEFGPGAELTLVSVEGAPEVQWRSSIDPEGAISPAVISSNFLVVPAADGLVRGWRVK